MTNIISFYQIKSYYCNSNVTRNIITISFNWMIFKQRKIVGVVQLMEPSIDTAYSVESELAVLVEPAILLGVKPAFYTTCWNE